MPTNPVTPIALTSILPFGIDPNSGFYRFSVCIDLKSVYAERILQNGDKEIDSPDGEKLAEFIQSYGISRGGSTSIYQTLVESLVCKINDDKNIQIPGYPPYIETAPTVNGTACFSEFSPSVIEENWRLLLNTPTKMFKEGLDLKAQIEPARRNSLVGKEFAALQEKGDPMAVNRGLIGLLAALREGEPITTPISDQVLGMAKSLAAKSRPVFSNLALTNHLLTGINTYATAENARQADQFAKNKQNKTFRRSPLLSVDGMQEIFAFINSNVLLQRLFGTTIDFAVNPLELKLALPKKDPKVFKDLFTMQFFENKFSGIDRFSNIINWEHLKTNMEMFSEDFEEEIQVSGKAFDTEFTAYSYDIDSVLLNLAKIGTPVDIENTLRTAQPESIRHEVVKQLNDIYVSASTRGMTLHHEDVTAEATKLQEYLKTPRTGTNNSPLYAEDVIRGYRVGVIRSDTNGERKIAPLGLRHLELTDENGKAIPLPDEFKTQDFALPIDTAANALVEEETASGTKVKHKLVIPSAALTWPGLNLGMPSPFSCDEDDTSVPADEQDGAISPSTEAVTMAFSEIFKEVFLPLTVSYDGTPSGNSSPLETTRPLTITYRGGRTPKLIFGQDNEAGVTPEMKNGWAPKYRFAKKPKSSGTFVMGDKKFPTSPIIDFRFKRNEPVGHIQLVLQDQLILRHPDLPQRMLPASNRNGESLNELVIRNYDPSDSDQETVTGQQSARFILPPAISFEHAFWHGKIFEIHKQFGRSESYRWYKKYHFPIREGQQRLDAKGSPIPGSFYTAEDAFQGSTVLREFYSVGTTRSEIINYLPDPLCAGFRLEFYQDKEYRVKAVEYAEFEENEYYFTGQYPKINALRIVLKDIGTDLVTQSSETITIRLHKGAQLFVRARTILSDDYEPQFETHGNYNQATRYGHNDLLTPPLYFSLTHATQRPLLRPRIANTLQSQRELNKTQLTMRNAMQFEQLCVRNMPDGSTTYLPDQIPTGSIELYAKWEEYADDPNHVPSGDWTPNQPVNIVKTKLFDSQPGEANAVFETAVTFEKNLCDIAASLNKVGEDLNDRKNYFATVTTTHDVKTTKHLEKWVWVKSRSRFASYFRKEISEDIEAISRRSKDPYFLRILNSAKPAPPTISDRGVNLVTVLEESFVGNRRIRRLSMRRVRFYINRGRLTSGKGERVGFVVNEPSSLYNDFMVANHLVSCCGRDIVSDSVLPYDGANLNRQVLLTRANFVTMDPPDIQERVNGTLKEGNDLESFSPKYVPELGLMTYIPKFSKELNLWYVDVELDINDEKGGELHSPFLQLGIVHYQKYSMTSKVLEEDARISAVTKTGFVHLLATRVLEIEQLAKGKVKMTVSGDPTSIVSLDSTGLRTRFFAFIEERADNSIRWDPCWDATTQREVLVELTNRISSELTLTKRLFGYNYRLRVIETETRGTPNGNTSVVTSVKEIYDNKKHFILMSNYVDL